MSTLGESRAEIKGRKSSFRMSKTSKDGQQRNPGTAGRRKGERSETCETHETRRQALFRGWLSQERRGSQLRAGRKGRGSD